MFKSLAITIILSLLAQAAFAGDATITWVAPTKNTDNSTIPATGAGSLAGFKIYYKLRGVATPTIVNVNNPATRSYTIADLAAGTWDFSMTAYNVEGLESVQSSIVSKTISNTTPQPPTTTFVTVQTGAFNVVKRTNGFALIQVGTIPLNTPCDANQFVNGYYAVSTAAVTWSGSVRSTVVVAKCSVQ